MNKQDIYYTPGKEEFYDGFQYEELAIMMDSYYVNSAEELVKETTMMQDFGITTKPHTTAWIPMTYRFGKSFGRARVKYLDEDDLRECGFKTDKLPWQYFDGIHTLIDLNNNMISIIHRADDQCLFYGEIKNLSEFKILLKQLDIRYDKSN